MSYMDLFSLKGKKCVVTGVGAPNGIGIAFSEALADAGGDVIISDILPLNLEENTEKLRAMGSDSHWFTGDITSRESVEEFRDFVLDKFGRVDVLINNAAVFQNIAAEDMPYEDWQHVINVNLNGNFNMSQVFGRVMIEQKSGGSIIFCSSKSAFTVDRPQKHVGYNTSKAGLIMLAKGLAVEWARFGIRVNCIAPGNIATDGNQQRIDENHPYVAAWLQSIPMDRIGSIRECANAAIFLASDASSYVTGETIIIDGGYCCV